MGNSKNKRANRGIVLSIFLVLQIIMAVVGIFALFAMMEELVLLSQITRGTSAFQAQLTFYASILLLIFVIVCVFGVWFWRIWGYWGLIGAYIASIIIAVMTWQFQQIAVNLIGLAIFYYLTRNKVNSFLWKL